MIFYESAEHITFISSYYVLVKIYDSFSKNENNFSSLKMYILPVLVICKDSCRTTVRTGCMLQLQLHAVENCMSLCSVSKYKYLNIYNYLV